MPLKPCAFVLFLLLSSIEARSQSDHFLCYETWPKGQSVHPSALLVPFGMSLEDKKSGAMFSVLENPKTFASKKKMDLKFVRLTKGPKRPMIIMRSSDDEIFIINAKGISRELVWKHKNGVKKYKCFAEGSV